MLADLIRCGGRPAHSFDHTKEEALRAALAGVVPTAAPAAGA
jgi:hypothetical protein